MFTWNPYLHTCNPNLLTLASLYPPPSLPPPPPLPPPPTLLLSSCLVPLSHRYHCHRHFRCSLLIVVSPAVATVAAVAAAATCYLHRRHFCCSLLIVVCPRRCPAATTAYSLSPPPPPFSLLVVDCWLPPPLPLPPSPLFAITSAATVFAALC